jgi:hypothetical protein
MWRTFMTHDTITVFGTPPSYNTNASDSDINVILNPRLKLAEAVAPQNADGYASVPSALEAQTV